MIIHSFDDKTEPIVRIGDFYGEPKQLVDRCLIIFSKEIHWHLLETFPCEQIAEIGACNPRLQNDLQRAGDRLLPHRHRLSGSDHLLP